MTKIDCAQSVTSVKNKEVRTEDGMLGGGRGRGIQKQLFYQHQTYNNMFPEQIRVTTVVRIYINISEENDFI